MSPQAADQHGPSLDDLCADLAANRHVIVASNRGPVTFTARRNEPASVSTSVAGYASAFSGKLPLTFVSVAASPADREISEQTPDGLITRGLPEGWTARMVSPSRRAFHRYYNIICNPLLWFLHHRSWGYTHTPNIDSEAHTAWDRGFLAVSRMLAEEIAAEADRVQRPVAVLIRGYHMHLLGGLVRELVPDAVIHYAPEVPWPDPGDWMMLPPAWRESVFRSLAACDSLGLASNTDLRNLEACLELFQVEQHQSTPDTSAPETHLHLSAIDQESLFSAVDSPRTRLAHERLEDGRFSYVTTDRAEPHKNIVRAIRAFGSMLEQNKNLADDVRYLLVLAPPPPHLAQYRRYVREIEQAAADENKRHGTRAGNPVQLTIENNYPLALAAMQIADVLISTPIADASSSSVLATVLINRRDSTFVLSEQLAITSQLADSALCVSPTDIEAMTSAFLNGYEMSEAEAEQRFKAAESVALDLTQESEAVRVLERVLAASRRRYSSP